MDRLTDGGDEMLSGNAANWQTYVAYIFLNFSFCVFRLITKAAYQYMYHILRNHAL